MKGKTPKTLTIEGTLLASGHRSIDLRDNYPRYVDSLPFDTLTIQGSTACRVIVNDDVDQSYGIVSKGAYADGGLFIHKIHIINDDAVSALEYKITLKQTGV